MAQGSYLNTYQTYKAGTKRLTTWLVQSAKLCGVTVIPSTRDKYQIPLGQFLHLARTITESKRPNIIVPREIVATSSPRLNQLARSTPFDSKIVPDYSTSWRIMVRTGAAAFEKDEIP